VEVPPAKHGVGVEESSATFLTMLKPSAPGAEAKVVVGNGDGPAASLDQVRKAVADGVKQGKRKVVLQADGAVPHGEVLKLAASVTEVEGVTLHIGVQEAER
jgi:biopolymer transport protein ExbD